MLEKLITLITGTVLAIGSLFIAPVVTIPVPDQLQPQEDLGGFSPVAGGTYRLKTSIGSTDTTIVLSSLTEPITGSPITMTSLNSDIGYATVDPQSSTRKEFVSFTGITQNADGSATLTGVSRGLGFQYPYTASSTLRKSHPGQSIFILSDSPQLFNEYARIRSNEIITGQWTFSNFPITPSSTPGTATTTGTVELATGAEAASSTPHGDIGSSFIVLHTGISTSTAPSSGSVVPVTGLDGKLDYNFIPSLVGSTTIRTITDTATGLYYTKPTNTALRAIIVEVVGAGGNGGGGTSEGAGGGGGGGYTKKVYAPSQLTATTSYRVGTSTNKSWFGSSTGLYATAGDSVSTETQGGLGGCGFNGDINLCGNPGTSRAGSDTGSSGNSNADGGNGGGSFFGGGGRGSRNNPSGPAASAGGYGGGGGGGDADNSPYGAAGGQGIIVITEQY